MFKHKTADGKRNICGEKIKMLRKNLPEKVSQRMLAEMMQLKGIDIDKSAIRYIENGSRYVTDIEIKAFCSIFSVSADYLLN
jgi:transcriptional regulator with XRE-family HTH domain